jgi:hypothetical protein
VAASLAFLLSLALLELLILLSLSPCLQGGTRVNSLSGLFWLRVTLAVPTQDRVKPLAESHQAIGSWESRVLIATLRPKGRLHFVGAVLEPIPINAFDLIMTERNVSGSPNGSPVTMADMFEFAARHQILPQTEHFPLDRVNDAIARLKAGKARYRIVLDI